MIYHMPVHTLSELKTIFSRFNLSEIFGFYARSYYEDTDADYRLYTNRICIILQIKWSLNFQKKSPNLYPVKRNFYRSRKNLNSCTIVVYVYKNDFHTGKIIIY